MVTEVYNPRSVRRETYGYLPSRRTSHYNAAVLRPSKNHSCCCVQVRRQIRCTILVLSFTRLASQCTCCFCIPHVPNSFCRHVLLFDAKIKKKQSLNLAHPVNYSWSLSMRRIGPRCVFSRPAVELRIFEDKWPSSSNILTLLYQRLRLQLAA